MISTLMLKNTRIFWKIYVIAKAATEFKRYLFGIIRMCLEDTELVPCYIPKKQLIISSILENELKH